MAEVFGSLTARGAEAWTRWGIRQRSFARVGHFSAGGNGLFISRQLQSPPERYMERKDDRPPSTGDVEETVVTR